MRLLALGFFLAVNVSVSAAESDRERFRREDLEYQAKHAAQFEDLMRGVSSLELFILDPAEKRIEPIEVETDASRLDGWKIVSKTAVVSEKEISQITAGLKRGILDNEKVAAMCFEPRHGLSFQKRGRTVTVTICFQCLQMEVAGSEDFRGAMMNPAGAREIYLILLAHGLMPKSQVAAVSDEELSKRLTGTWTSGSPGADKKFPVYFEWLDTFGRDGEYRHVSTTYLGEGVDPKKIFGEEITKGRWRVERGILIFTEIKRSKFMNAPKEYSEAIMSLTSQKGTFKSTASTSDVTLERVRK